MKDSGLELIASLKRQNKKLRKALLAAKTHLEYCNYGDNWERECAGAQKLPQKIEEALKV